MNNLTQTGVSLLVFSVFILAPTTSFALAPFSPVDADLNGTITTEVETQIETTTTNIETTTNPVVNTQTNINAGANVGVEAGSQDEKEATLYSDLSLEMNASGVAIISSSQVQSESDLNILSSNIATKNEAVAKITTSSTSDEQSMIKVVYLHKGDFLGFIPVTIKSTTVVETKTNADATVTSTLPWWGFLVANKNYAKADLESNIENNVSVKSNARVATSAQSQAQIMEAVVAEIEAQAHLEASVSK